MTWSVRSTCAWTAAVTRGWRWPRIVVAVPVRSRGTRGRRRRTGDGPRRASRPARSSGPSTGEANAGQPPADRAPRPRSSAQYRRPRWRSIEKRAVSAMAMTAIVPAWTGSETTRSAAPLEPTAMFRETTGMPTA